jgi:hypothetical protein
MSWRAIHFWSKVIFLTAALFPSAAFAQAEAETGLMLTIGPDSGSLIEVRDQVRQWRKAGGNGPVTIVMNAGRYFLSRPLEMETVDSGRAGAPVVFRAAASGTVRILGAVPLLGPPAGWRRGELLHFPVPAPIGEMLVGESRIAKQRPGFELFWNGRPLPLARWPDLVDGNGPNQSWAYLDAVEPKGSRDRFISRRLPPELLTNPTGAEVHLFSQVEWLDEVIAIKSFDAATGEIQLDRPASYPLTPGARFFVQNVRSALNQPGEWWFDRKTGELTVVAPESSAATREIYVSHLDTLLEVKGASHLRFEGLGWEGATGDAIELRDADDCEFFGNRIANVGGWGIVAKTNGRLLLAGNTITEMGLGGMQLVGGEQVSLTAAQIVARDNVVSDIDRLLLCYMPAFRLNGVAIKVEHNRISHLPHNALMLAGNNHRIEANIFEDVCFETNDVGAIYTGSDWSTRGTVIAGNVFRRIAGRHFDAASNNLASRYSSGGAAYGIYLDDLLESSTIRENVFEDIQSAAIHLAGGSYHLVINNFFVRTKGALFMWAQSDFTRPWERLQPYLQPGSPFFSAYPEIKDREKNNPLVPSHIEFRGNHLLEVPLPYDIRLLGTQNVFAENHFAVIPPAAEVVLSDLSGKKVPLKTWAAWRQAGFDGDAVVERQLTPAENDAMSKIIRNAGPRLPVPRH